MTTHRGDVHRAIDAVWRIEASRLIAGLARIVRDVGLAEDLAQDALVAALEQWPASGVPRNPGAWLMAAAKHRAIDHWRRKKLLERKHLELGHELESEREQRALSSPVVELNRAVAVGMARGPEAALALVDGLRAEPSLKQYHFLPSVRGDLLAKLGRYDEARTEFERAAALTRNARER
jgi:predicted RNA polymerase sigma factor